MPRIDIFDLPEDVSYSTNHTWVRVEANLVKVGLDDFSQKLMDLITKVQLPSVGSKVETARVLCKLELTKKECEGAVCTYVKKQHEIPSPVTGVVRDVNSELVGAPELINEDPYGKGWIVAIESPNLENDLGHLLAGQAAVKWLESEIVSREDEIAKIREAWREIQGGS